MWHSRGLTTTRSSSRCAPSTATRRGGIGQSRCGDAIPIFERGLRVYPDGTVIRSRLFECLLTIGRVDDAITIAEAGIARGLPEFAKSVERAQRARTAPPNH